MNINDILYGFSRPLFSTWVHYKPDNFLLDCGEGCATSMFHHSYAIEKIFLTHGHSDHIAGLPAFLWSRASSMGSNDKKLEIFYPVNHQPVLDMKSYIDTVFRRPPFELKWTPLGIGATVPLHSGRFIQTFPTRHIRGSLTLGYSVIEPRKRLKPEYANLSQNEIKEMAKAGKRDFSENYEATVISFGGDGIPIDAEFIQDAEILVHEATILAADDMKGNSHSSLKGALKAAQRANVGTLVLYHVSGRYTFKDAITEIKRESRDMGITFPIYLLKEDSLNKVFFP